MPDEMKRITEETKPKPTRSTKSAGQILLDAVDMKALAQRIDAAIAASDLLETLDRADAPGRANHILRSCLKIDGGVLVDTLKGIRNAD